MDQKHFQETIKDLNELAKDHGDTKMMNGCLLTMCRLMFDIQAELHIMNTPKHILKENPPMGYNGGGML